MATGYGDSRSRKDSLMREACSYRGRHKLTEGSPNCRKCLATNGEVKVTTRPVKCDPPKFSRRGEPYARGDEEMIFEKKNCSVVSHGESLYAGHYWVDKIVSVSNVWLLCH